MKYDLWCEQEHGDNYVNAYLESTVQPHSCVDKMECSICNSEEGEEYE